MLVKSDSSEFFTNDFSEAQNVIILFFKRFHLNWYRDDEVNSGLRHYILKTLLIMLLIHNMKNG